MTLTVLCNLRLKKVESENNLSVLCQFWGLVKVFFQRSFMEFAVREEFGSVSSLLVVLASLLFKVDKRHTAV